MSECVYSVWVPSSLPRFNSYPFQRSPGKNEDEYWKSVGEHGWMKFIHWFQMGIRCFFFLTVPLNWKGIQVWDLVKQFRVIAVIAFLMATTVALWLYWELNTCLQLRNVTTAIPAILKTSFWNTSVWKKLTKINDIIGLDCHFTNDVWSKQLTY